MNHLIARGYPTLPAPVHHAHGWWLPDLPLHHISDTLARFLLWYILGWVLIMGCNILADLARCASEFSGTVAAGLARAGGGPRNSRGEPPELYLWAVEAIVPAILAAYTATIVVTIKWWLGGDAFLPTWAVAAVVAVIVLRRCYCWRQALRFVLRPALRLALFAVTSWAPWSALTESVTWFLLRQLPDNCPVPSQEDVDAQVDLRGPNPLPRDFR